MKALIKKEPKIGLCLEDVPIPQIKDNEILIKTLKTAIYGTDLHIYNWDEWAQKTIPVPLIIGHEFIGEITKIGKNVSGFREGDRVTGEGHITCGHCPPCRMGKRHLCMNTIGLGVKRSGCFSEYFSLPAENVFPLPASIPDEIAAIFDPYGNAVHTSLSFPLPGEDVLITGAGPIGIMAAAISHKAGARTVIITDKNQFRLDLARNMGATHTVNIARQSISDVMKEAGVEFGFTVGMEMSGHPAALSEQLNKAQPGAHISLLGILPADCLIDWDLVIFKMLNIKGIYGREIFSTWYQMVHLLEGGLNLSPLITHRFKADDYEKGFITMKSGSCGKVILEW
jgi:threonine 3-dehydrogenase